MAAKFFLLLTLLSQAALSSLSERCHPEDKRALLQIKKEFNNPTRLVSSWKPHVDCCDDSKWYGVICSPNNNRVLHLSIFNITDIVSQFPPSIGNLVYLETLYLDILPNPTGPIPHSITKLTKLKQLIISSTGVSGPIPKFLAQFKSLDNLYLSRNHLFGPLPPSLYKLPRLQQLEVSHNRLTGSIPPTYGYFNNSNLHSLFLNHNQLSGTLPKSLARLNSIFIDLSHNRFEGDASMLFGGTKVTMAIKLSQNLFAFDLGKVELPNKLNTLDVSHNKIYGKLPLGIENVSSFLNVSYNRLCGEIPRGGFLERFDEYAFFRNKCLCGSPLPKCK